MRCLPLPFRDDGCSYFFIRYLFSDFEYIIFTKFHDIDAT